MNGSFRNNEQMQPISGFAVFRTMNNSHKYWHCALVCCKYGEQKRRRSVCPIHKARGILNGVLRHGYSYNYGETISPSCFYLWQLRLNNMMESPSLKFRVRVGREPISRGCWARFRKYHSHESVSSSVSVGCYGWVAMVGLKLRFKGVVKMERSPFKLAKRYWCGEKARPAVFWQA